jgi:hypothetical protein
MTMAEMNTADQIRAERIARAGAAKMTAAGYTFRPVRGTGFLPAAAREVFYVVKPDVVLAAQALTVTLPVGSLVIATENVAHLSRYAPAAEWRNITP